jgi:hypothetical protein
MNKTRAELQAARDETVGRTNGHPWEDPVAANGESRWPPTGRFPWPPSQALSPRRPSPRRGAWTRSPQRASSSRYEPTVVITGAGACVCTGLRGASAGFETRWRTPGTGGAWGEMRVRGRMLVPTVAEILCQRCGAQTEAIIANGRASVRPCPCGGMRQVVRVVHHRGGQASASPAQVERNVRHRSDEEAPPHGRRNRP